MIIGKGNRTYPNPVLLLCTLAERFAAFLRHDSSYLTGGKSSKVKLISRDISNRLFSWLFIYLDVHV